MVHWFLSVIKLALAVINILILSSLLVACGNYQAAQVADRDQPPSRRIGSKSQAHTHVVTWGDTLYSIAWRYGLDYRGLAQHNRISPPYTIYPGQRIRLATAPLPDKKMTDRPAVARPSVSTPPPMATRPRQGTSPATTPAATPPVSVARPPSTPPQTSSRSENRTPASSSTPPQPMAAGTPQWQWPSQGKLIAGFQGQTGLNKGIDIAGNLGQPVLAAASGQVVYAGTGLRGYGKLLIIKHNDTFLSAYAHNNKLLVNEGDWVKAGQRIADMGSSGTDRVKLHFEIRRGGSPVDPMKYLPRR